jgi:hypothetical protein
MKHAKKLQLAAVLQAMLGLGRDVDYAIDAMMEVCEVDKQTASDFVYSPESIAEREELYEQVNAVMHIIVNH